MAHLKMISTGSQSGNCYVYKNFMLDIGVSFIKIKQVIKEIDYIFISHNHGDHIRLSTVKRVARDYPDIIFISGKHFEELFKELNLRHITVDDNNTIWLEKDKLHITLNNLYHDIPNKAIHIHDIENDVKGLYATDTNHLIGITAKDYDWYCIEYNHDTEVHQDLIKNASSKAVKDRFSNALVSHLSFEQCDQFIQNNAKIGSEIMKVHLSTAYNEVEHRLHYIYEGEEE